jgi:hypothetical protein
MSIKHSKYPNFDDVMFIQQAKLKNIPWPNSFREARALPLKPE